MTAKEIMALAQAHRREGGLVAWRSFANAVREVVAERDAAVADAELWRAYKARKDAVLAAGMGRPPLRADIGIGGEA